MNEDIIIPDDSITTDKIADLNVTSEKIANNSIISEKIFNLSVTGDKISKSAISTEKIADFNITTDKIKDGAITNQKIANHSISTDKLDRNLRLDGSVMFSALSPNKLVILNKDKVLTTVETTPNSIIVLNRDNYVTIVQLQPNKVVRTDSNGLPTTNENNTTISMKVKGDVAGVFNLKFDMANEVTINLSQNILDRLHDIESNVGIVRDNPSDFVGRLITIESTLNDFE